MKLALAVLITAPVLLQYRLWVSDEGMREVWHLRQAVEAQGAENAALAERNAQIKAEVADLKHGLTALEERARNDLGMVRKPISRTGSPALLTSPPRKCSPPPTKNAWMGRSPRPCL